MHGAHGACGQTSPRAPPCRLHACLRAHRPAAAADATPLLAASPHITWAVMAGDADRGPWARCLGRARRNGAEPTGAATARDGWVGLPAVSGPWATRGPAAGSMRSVMEQTKWTGKINPCT